MKVSRKSGQRSFKPPFLMLTILGIHVAAAGFFMMMSGCSTKRPAVEPPPAPVMPPSAASRGDTPVPRPSFKAPNAEKAPSTIDAAGASSYTIQKGDLLSKIAVRAGVSVKEISELNNITNPNKIRVGQTILLPAHAKSLPSSPAPKRSASKPKKSAPKKSSGPAVDSGDVHTVVSGDTLGKLAIRYGSSIAAFKEVNNLKSDTIRINQKLKVPKSSGSSSAPVSRPKADPEPAPAMPAPAAAAPIAAEAAPAPTAVDDVLSDIDDGSDTTPFPYTVKRDDTLEGIALKFSARKDVIMRLNSMTSETVTPGQKLLIPWQ